MLHPVAVSTAVLLLGRLMVTAGMVALAALVLRRR
jgi:hypothetical protein